MLFCNWNYVGSIASNPFLMHRCTIVSYFRGAKIRELIRKYIKAKKAKEGDKDYILLRLRKPKMPECN